MRSLSASLSFIWCVSILHHLVNVGGNVFTPQERGLCGSAESLLIYGLLLSKQLPCPLNGHTMGVLSILASHDGDYVMFLSSSKHGASSLSATKGIVIG